ncbi:hypothetical protein W245_02773, partial [Staphylococcus aureus DAR1859]
DAFDKYYLFDHDGNKMFSVTPHFKDGRHLVVVFIDNAESVTELIKTESQQIQLIVNEQDKKLRMETI